MLKFFRSKLSRSNPSSWMYIAPCRLCLLNLLGIFILSLIVSIAYIYLYTYPFLQIYHYQPLHALHNFYTLLPNDLYILIHPNTTIQSNQPLPIYLSFPSVYSKSTASPSDTTESSTSSTQHFPSTSTYEHYQPSSYLRVVIDEPIPMKPKKGQGSTSTFTSHYYNRVPSKYTNRLHPNMNLHGIVLDHHLLINSGTMDPYQNINNHNNPHNFMDYNLRYEPFLEQFYSLFCLSLYENPLGSSASSTTKNFNYQNDTIQQLQYLFQYDKEQSEQQQHHHHQQQHTSSSNTHSTMDLSSKPLISAVYTHQYVNKLLQTYEQTILQKLKEEELDTTTMTSTASSAISISTIFAYRMMGLWNRIMEEAQQREAQQPQNFLSMYTQADFIMSRFMIGDGYMESNSNNNQHDSAPNIQKNRQHAFERIFNMFSSSSSPTSTAKLSSSSSSSISTSYVKDIFDYKLFSLNVDPFDVPISKDYTSAYVCSKSTVEALYKDLRDHPNIFLDSSLFYYGTIFITLTSTIMEMFSITFFRTFVIALVLYYPLSFAYKTGNMNGEITFQHIRRISLFLSYPLLIWVQIIHMFLPTPAEIYRSPFASPKDLLRWLRLDNYFLELGIHLFLTLVFIVHFYDDIPVPVPEGIVPNIIQAPIIQPPVPVQPVVPAPTLSQAIGSNRDSIPNHVQRNKKKVVSRREEINEDSSSYASSTDSSSDSYSENESHTTTTSSSYTSSSSTYTSSRTSSSSRSSTSSSSSSSVHNRIRHRAVPHSIPTVPSTIHPSSTKLSKKQQNLWLQQQKIQQQQSIQNFNSYLQQKQQQLQYLQQTLSLMQLSQQQQLQSNNMNNTMLNPVLDITDNKKENKKSQ